MNLLELVKELAGETSTVSPSQITTVETITDEHVEDLTRWIVRSNEDIERLHEDWRFRMREGVVELVEETTDYDLKTYLGDDYFKKIVPFKHPWHYSHVHVGSNRSSVQYVPYRQWAGRYDRRLEFTTASKPLYFTVLPTEQIRVYPKPDKAYELKFNYIRRPLVMERLDACEPAMPAEFQRLVILWALRQYAFHDEADKRIQTVTFQIDQHLMDMRNDQLPGIHVDEPTGRGSYGGAGYR